MSAYIVTTTLPPVVELWHPVTPPTEKLQWLQLQLETFPWARNLLNSTVWLWVNVFLSVQINCCINFLPWMPLFRWHFPTFCLCLLLRNVFLFISKDSFDSFLVYCIRQPQHLSKVKKLLLFHVGSKLAYSEDKLLTHSHLWGTSSLKGDTKGRKLIKGDRDMYNFCCKEDGGKG